MFLNDISKQINRPLCFQMMFQNKLALPHTIIFEQK